MMNLYIIGPVTGIENDNRPEFERVRWTLKGVDGVKEVGIPHDYVLAKRSWNDAMRKSIIAMLDKRFCDIDTWEYDGIAMLDGWQNSDGAMLEHEIATRLEIPCKPWREWLEGDA